MKKSVEWLFPKPAPAQSAIDRIELLIGWRFPTSYRNVVCEYNGAYPKPSECLLGRPQGMSFNNMIAISFPGDELKGERIIEVVDALGGRLPKNVVPFAADPSGNYFCFDFNHVGDSGEPSIVFWDHENEDHEQRDPWLAVTCVCGSFDELITSLI
ncbi:MAG: hypothetical protein C0478_17405 [Planctomyces sp.]|nr:hypothetical protein [Planctomyces sp.]